MLYPQGAPESAPSLTGEPPVESIFLLYNSHISYWQKMTGMSLFGPYG